MPVVGLAPPKEKAFGVEVEDGAPKAVGVVELNEKAEGVAVGLVWPKADVVGAPNGVGAVGAGPFL